MSQNDKESLRAQFLNWRKQQLTEEKREQLSQQVCDNLLSDSVVREADVILTFASINNEVSLVPFLKNMPESTILALPRIDGDELLPVQVPDREKLIDSLETGSTLDGYRRDPHGILEPATGTVLETSRLDVVLVPGLVFDRHGGRIGYGEGYYDRFLSSLKSNTVTIGICFSRQLLDEDLPTESHDVDVDRVVTERGME